MFWWKTNFFSNCSHFFRKRKRNVGSPSTKSRTRIESVDRAHQLYARRHRVNFNIGFAHWSNKKLSLPDSITCFKCIYVLDSNSVTIKQRCLLFFFFISSTPSETLQEMFGCWCFGGAKKISSKRIIIRNSGRKSVTKLKKAFKCNIFLINTRK